MLTLGLGVVILRPALSGSLIANQNCPQLMFLQLIPEIQRRTRGMRKLGKSCTTLAVAALLGMGLTTPAIAATPNPGDYPYKNAIGCGEEEDKIIAEAAKNGEEPDLDKNMNYNQFPVNIYNKSTKDDIDNMVQTLNMALFPESAYSEKENVPVKIVPGDIEKREIRICNELDEAVKVQAALTGINAVTPNNDFLTDFKFAGVPLAKINENKLDLIKEAEIAPHKSIIIPVEFEFVKDAKTRNVSKDRNLSEAAVRLSVTAWNDSVPKKEIPNNTGKSVVVPKENTGSNLVKTGVVVGGIVIVGVVVAIIFKKKKGKKAQGQDK